MIRVGSPNVIGDRKEKVVTLSFSSYIICPPPLRVGISGVEILLSTLSLFLENLRNFKNSCRKKEELPI